MPLSPDIVVTKPDLPEILLAVEGKGGAADIQNAEVQLKAYMVYMDCPVGMLVTFEETRFYRNRYTGNEPQTVEGTGVCATSELLGPLPARSSLAELYLERLVIEWLGGLWGLGGRGSWPAPCRGAVGSRGLSGGFQWVVRASRFPQAPHREESVA